jgi:hypothetical protein
MTPKERAKELVIKYINIDYGNVDFYDLDLNYLTDIMRYNPREFAIIAVDTILDMLIGSLVTIEYWKEVKQEIEKL